MDKSELGRTSMDGLLRQDERARLDFSVGRGRQLGSDPKQGLESSHGRPPAVESEHELVEIGLQLALGDAPIRALEPGLQVADHAVGARQDFEAILAEPPPSSEALELMVVAEGAQSFEALPCIGLDGGTIGNVVHDRAIEGVSGQVGDVWGSKMSSGRDG